MHIFFSDKIKLRTKSPSGGDIVYIAIQKCL